MCAGMGPPTLVLTAMQRQSQENAVCRRVHVLSALSHALSTPGNSTYIDRSVQMQSCQVGLALTCTEICKLQAHGAFMQVDGPHRLLLR